MFTFPRLKLNDSQVGLECLTYRLFCISIDNGKSTYLKYLISQSKHISLLCRICIMKRKYHGNELFLLWLQIGWGKGQNVVLLSTLWKKFRILLKGRRTLCYIDANTLATNVIQIASSNFALLKNRCVPPSTTTTTKISGIYFPSSKC